MCSITEESLKCLFRRIYRDIDSQLILPHIDPIHGLGTIIIVVQLIALHGVKFHLRGLIHLESLFRRRPLRLKPEDEYTVYEVEETDTDEEADLLNFDDLDSDEFV